MFQERYMKVIEFIKRNISVFNIVALSLILTIIIGFFSLEKDNFWNSTITLIYILGIGLSLLFLIFDFLTKKNIHPRLKLNLIQLFILIIIPLIYYFLILIS